MLGLVLGVLFAIRCAQRQQLSQDMPHPHPHDNLFVEDTNLNYIPLTALGWRDDIDLQQCYRNALISRHLTHCDSLSVIPTDEILLHNIIGEGTFGRVWNALRRNTDVAVKEFVFAQAALSGGGSQQINEIIEEIIGEACVMSCLRHPKILTLYGVSLTTQALWIVCELCDQGSLRMLLNDTAHALTERQKLSFCLDVADGMMYLHQRRPPIIHRDIKSHNIFIVETSPGKLTAKIGDWGSARVVAAMSDERSYTQGVGTACWLSPEVILNAHYSKASDVYAYGIVLWEVYTRQHVYPRLSAPQIIARVANEGLRPTVPLDCPWETLMKSCWDQSPSARPPFAEIIARLATMYSRTPLPGPPLPSPP
jgi:serine/threonine protein kinase